MAVVDGSVLRSTDPLPGDQIAVFLYDPGGGNPIVAIQKMAIVDENNDILGTSGNPVFVDGTVLQSLLTELEKKADLTETQPVSVSGGITIPAGIATEAKQDDSIVVLQNILADLQLKADATEAQLVTATAFPLPTGAATEIKQDDIVTVLGNILTDLQSKADLIETQPVSLLTIPLAAGAATEAKQDTIVTALASLLTELEQKADLTETQPVSAASLPLPAGAATEAKQDSVITELVSLNAPVASTWDYVKFTYTSGSVTGITYRNGGAAGVIVATLALSYNLDGTLDTIDRTFP